MISRQDSFTHAFLSRKRKNTSLLILTMTTFMLKLVQHGQLTIAGCWNKSGARPSPGSRLSHLHSSQPPGSQPKGDRQLQQQLRQQQQPLPAAASPAVSLLLSWRLPALHGQPGGQVQPVDYLLARKTFLV
jgi:hypothetical protein